MKKIKKIINVLFYKRNYLYLKLIFLLKNIIPDKLYIELYYKFSMGKKLNLDNPKTFNEKLNWLKLYDHNPLYTLLVDKFEVKEWVKKKIGEQYVIPTLGVWDTFENINFDILPNKFVLKTTHGGGSVGVVVCTDKKKFNIEYARKKINASMKISGYETLREWPYKNVKRRVIAEKYIEDETTNVLPDYKFFCFNGQVKALFIANERNTGNVKFDFFDENFNHLDLVQIHPMYGKEILKPKSFELMKKLSSKLSEGIPEVRVDFYEVNGQPKFGEMTFFHHGGCVPFHPEKYDEIFGSWITLPNGKNK